MAHPDEMLAAILASWGRAHLRRGAEVPWTRLEERTDADWTGRSERKTKVRFPDGDGRRTTTPEAWLAERKRLGASDLCLVSPGAAEPAVVGGTPEDRRLGPEPLLPERERVLGRDAPGDRVDHSRAGASAAHAGILEEGDVAARAPLLVRVEEVVDGRVVLVDGLLHEPEAEDARVEVDVARRVRGDAGDVVDAVQAHEDQRSRRTSPAEPRPLVSRP